MTDAKIISDDGREEFCMRQKASAVGRMRSGNFGSDSSQARADMSEAMRQKRERQNADRSNRRMGPEGGRAMAGAKI